MSQKARERLNIKYQGREERERKKKMKGGEDKKNFFTFLHEMAETVKLVRMLQPAIQLEKKKKTGLKVQRIV